MSNSNINFFFAFSPVNDTLCLAHIISIPSRYNAYEFGSNGLDRIALTIINVESVVLHPGAIG